MSAWHAFVFRRSLSVLALVNVHFGLFILTGLLTWWILVRPGFMGTFRALFTITDSVGFQILLLQIAELFVMHNCGFWVASRKLISCLNTNLWVNRDIAIF